MTLPIECSELTSDRRRVQHTVRRSGMDHDLFRIGPPYDSGCWVRDSQTFFFDFVIVLLTKLPAY